MTVVCSGNRWEGAHWWERPVIIQNCQISSGHWTRLPKWKWPECHDVRTMEEFTGEHLRNGRFSKNLDLTYPRPSTDRKILICGSIWKIIMPYNGHIIWLYHASKIAEKLFTGLLSNLQMKSSYAKTDKCQIQIFWVCYTRVFAI
jgi:hypothetical protein